MNDAKVLVRFNGDTKNLDNATSQAKKGLGSFKGFAKGIGASVAGVAAAATATATAMLVDVTKQSLQARADFEQYIGGTKLLFGDAADYIEKKSREAYKAAGMSTNQYLQQVNGFAVGLKNSLGGNEKAAAKLADKIITAEADIVAATGNTQEAVQNAFNGIMKGNFTMLDNLQLGIKPTKKGMEEVIDKVNDWNKAQGHATKYQMDNYADMQAALVDYVKMQGLAGYAAKEATGTITGSISAAKAAWQNFLTGTGSAKEVVDMVINAGKNIGKELIKIIPDVASGLAELINGLIPLIPGLVSQLAPVLTKAIVSLVKSLVDIIPSSIKPLVIGITGIVAAFKTIATVISIIKTVKAALISLKAVIMVINAVMLANPIGIIVAAVAGLVAIFVVLWKKCEKFRNFWINLWEGIKTAFSSVINWIKTNWKSILLFLINPFAGAFKYLYDHCEKFRTFVNNFVTNIVNFVKKIPSFIASIPEQIIAFIQKIPYYIGYALGWIIGQVVNFFTRVWEFITVDVPAIVTSVITWISQLPGKIWNFLVNTITKVKVWAVNFVAKAKEAAKNFVNNVINWVKQLPSRVWTWLQNMINRLSTWASEMWKKSKEGAKNFAKALINGIKNLPERVGNIGRNIVRGLWNGIKSAKDWMIDKVKSFAEGILDGMKSALGIHSPSKEFALIGKFSVLGYTEALESMKQDVEKAIDGTFSLSPNVTNSASTNFSPSVNVINNIEMKQDPLGQMVNQIKTFSGGAKNDYNYGKA